MQFMALIYAEEGTGPQPGTDEFGAFMGAYMAFGETLKKDGAWIAGDAPLSVLTGLVPLGIVSSLGIRLFRSTTKRLNRIGALPE